MKFLRHNLRRAAFAGLWLLASGLCAPALHAQVKTVSKTIATDALLEGFTVPSGKTITFASGSAITLPDNALAIGDVSGLQTALDAKTAATRTISTTAPLTGGGDLSANRTLAVSSATTSATGVVELATSAEAIASTDPALVAPLDAASRQMLTGLAPYDLGFRTSIGNAPPRDIQRLFRKWISETPNGLNIALGLTIGDRRNLWQYTENLGSNRYVGSSATKGSDTIVVDGITLTKITAGSFYSTLRSQVNGLGLTPYTSGEYYITSCFVVSAQDHDQWPGMPYIGATGSNGAINRRLLSPGKIQRLHMLNKATSTSHLDYGGAGTVAWGVNTGYDTFWPGFGGYPDSSGSAANSLVLYVGGFQVERVVSDGRYGIVGIGDSTMQGASGSTDLATSISWLHQMGAIIQCQVFNRGVSGNQTSVMDGRWATDITPLAARCKYAVIQPSAANDIPNGISLATTQAAVVSMVAKAIADSLIPVVVVPPSTYQINANSGYKTTYDQLCAWIRQTYPLIIDNAKICNDPLSPYVLRRQTDWEGDGIHFGSEASRAVADAAAALPFWDFPRPSPYQPIALTTYTAPTLQLWDAATSTIKAVELGAADSGGTGYKLLRVAN